jgi:hypothetical protein
MNGYLDRIQRYKGTPYEIGLAAGRALGPRLERTIDHYLARREPGIDQVKLHQGALPWLRRLPKRFQDEYEGMAEGAGIPLQKLAEWTYVEECEGHRCSGAIGLFDGRAWVARNNDTFVPEVWGYVTIREIDGRIPTIGFSMEGDVFAPTGINREKLWLHTNFLSAWDEPSPGKRHYPGYVLLTEALEVCRTLDEVEAFLKESHRDGGMMLFAVDGKTNEFAIFECLSSKHFRREPSEGWIVGTNHFCACEDRTLGEDEGSVNTVKRFRRMSHMLEDLYAAPKAANLPTDLIRVLADDGIERRGTELRRGEELVTAYANVACPATGEIWYTFGGFPAASAGNWQRLEWPWAD